MGGPMHLQMNTLLLRSNRQRARIGAVDKRPVRAQSRSVTLFVFVLSFSLSQKSGSLSNAWSELGGRGWPVAAVCMVPPELLLHDSCESCDLPSPSIRPCLGGLAGWFDPTMASVPIRSISPCVVLDHSSRTRMNACSTHVFDHSPHASPPSMDPPRLISSCAEAKLV
ncbi:uncharacterized protein LY79DRAFT_233936 [Colletotrichum navitas]|uniref:Uncharacterized protein n=1 Tax=Colletotrichum navitas TaxID=681940 RepID=A0AAD8PXI6_9PEZI|nr:uncharacterized protein LY79DRAFT_233936 [Colletotrichum navitas]KAK1589761.1 hypothetical protein LY79DRAFT_233936 [Colletotrichum navitas]